MNGFQLTSWLWFHRGQPVKVDLWNGKEGDFVAIRRAWFGPALCLRIEGELTYGWDPATVSRLKPAG